MLSALSNVADKVNGPILFISAVCVFLLIAITLVMIYFTIRYSRRRNTVVSEAHGHTTLEVVWTVIPTLLAFGMFWYGWVGYKFMKSPPADAMNVAVTGRMWSWSHEYENGIVAPELTIPVGKPVKLNLHSGDVIHSYFIPAFKIKQDAVAGVDGLYLWFVAREIGTYQVFCAEYCGLNHSNMFSKVHVLSSEDFDAWYASEGANFAESRNVLDAGGSGGEGGGDLSAVGKLLATAKGCVACHSVDGSPLIGPTFKGLYGKRENVLSAGQEREIVVNDAYILKSILDPAADITKGFQPLMPSQQGLVTDKEIEALIAYVKSLQ